MGLFRTLFARSSLDHSVRTVLEDLLDDHAKRVREELGAIRTIEDLRVEKEHLTDRVRNLAKETADAEEVRAREKREMEHRLGLRVEELEVKERRLDEEKSVIVREAKVAAREEALAETREILKSQLDRLERVIDHVAGRKD